MKKATVKKAIVKKKRILPIVSYPRKPPLCRLHGKPIRPSRWRNGSRTSGCAGCEKKIIMPPDKKRLCKEHKIPIYRRRWWDGYRNKGCPLCFELPPPEERLCKRHGRPISPSAWLMGLHSRGCSKCRNSAPGMKAAQARYKARKRLRAKRSKFSSRWR